MSAVLKKEVVPKKTVRKSSVRTALAVPKKAPAKKTLPKKTLSTQDRAEIKPRKRVVKKAPKEEVVEAETVFVPSTASLRLLEKAELYRVWYRNNFPVTVARVAQVGGYVFIFAGTLLASATYLMSHNVAQYPAAVVCTAEVCSEVEDSALPANAPLIVFKNSLPEQLTSDTDIIVEIQNAKDFKMYLKNLTTGVMLDIAFVETVSPTEYRYLISPQGLSVSAYVLVAEATTPEATYKFSGPQFTVLVADEPEVEEEQVTEVLEVGTTTLFAQLESTSTDTTIDGGEESEVESQGEVLPALETALDTEQPEVNEIVIETPDVEEGVTSEVAIDTPALTPITATVEGLQSTRYLKVGTGTLLPLEVSIFSQVASSEQPLYLGLATLVQGEWIFSLAPLQLPSAEHLLYASFEVDGVRYQSEGVSFTPTYNTPDIALVDGDISILVQKIDLALLGNEGAYLNRNSYFSGLSSSSVGVFERSFEAQLADEELLDLLDGYMRSEQLAIDALFAQYAHVAQVGKKYLLTLSGKNTAAQTRTLARLVADDRGDSSIVPTLQTVLSLRYASLSELVTENESRLNQDTSSLTSRDSDQDGVSDYDEIVSYATNPSRPDSDADSILDAVEILSGSDPLTPDLTQIVSAGAIAEDVVLDEVVSIEQVEPLIVRGLESAQDSVYALVFGKSIPNSYVYVVSPTLGTVGVIQTNESGVFSYTLEKAILDGRHEVYAVVADAQGQIISSSKPRVFTKTKNTFVAAAVESQNGSFTAGDFKTVLQFSTITTALGVVALGLILLLLTHALRTRPKPMLSHAK